MDGLDMLLNLRRNVKRSVILYAQEDLVKSSEVRKALEQVVDKLEEKRILYQYAVWPGHIPGGFAIKSGNERYAGLVECLHAIDKRLVA